VELLLRVELPGGGSISQEVKPKDKMATDSQNGGIITLSRETGHSHARMQVDTCPALYPK
jgi:hypothetical protein